MRKIGLYGGSFDPVHHGHLLAAQAALEAIGLDRVIFIPAARSPFKPDKQPGPDHARVRMLEMAVQDRKDMEVDQSEILRGGISYTIDTVLHIRERFTGAELHYIIGADQCGGLPKWKDADRLRSLTHFAVIPRPGIPDARLPDGFQGTVLTGHMINISSTGIRGRIRRQQSIQWLVPPEIESFIHTNRLYL
jgi:nicotinate-nucleotide adenylyltransferase